MILSVYKEELLCRIKRAKVMKLNTELMRKYMGNSTFCTLPNVCLGSEKYRDSPDTKVIQIWAPKCVLTATKYTKVHSGEDTVCSLFDKNK